MNELTINKTLAEEVFNSVKVVNAQDKFEQVRVAIKTVYFVAGISNDKLPDKEEFNAMVNLLIKDIEHYYKRITVEELKIAFNNGVREYYGKYYGLSVKTFNDWIKAYLESEERKKRINENNYIETGINPIQKDEIRKEYLLKCLTIPFIEYKESKEWLFNRNNILGKYGLYELFKLNGYCIFDNKQTEKMIALAEKKYKKGHDKFKDHSRMIAFKFVLDEFIKSDTDITTVIKKFFESNEPISN